MVFNAFSVLAEGRLALGGIYSTVTMADNGVTTLTTLSGPGGIVNALIEVHDLLDHKP